MRQLLQNSKIRILVPPIAGFLFYGSWAFWVNSSYGWNSAIMAALTQGGYSFCITLLLAIVVEWLFQRLESIPLRSIWVFLAAFTLLLLTSSSINFLTGTPEILWTILPGLLVSSAYTVVYIITLQRLAINMDK